MTQSDTIAERLTRRFDQLTRAERQLAGAILENYPVSGLGSITQVAQAADVSSPTVARMVQKLGYKGFPEFQAELRRELEEKISGPIAKRDAAEAQGLHHFGAAVETNIRATLAQIDPAAFDAATALLADRSQALFVVGGRITRTLADYAFLQLQVIRERVTLIPSNSNAWPHALLDLGAGDVVLVFDIRRYETTTLKLAEMAAARGARLILVTDQWRSPVAQHAEISLNARIVVPSAWDSLVVPMLLVEALLAGVQGRIWETTKGRMEALEEMFDRTGLFRKFT